MARATKADVIEAFERVPTVDEATRGETNLVRLRIDGVTNLHEVRETLPDGWHVGTVSPDVRSDDRVCLDVFPD